MKAFLRGLFTLFTSFVMWIPIKWVRHCFLLFQFGKVGKKNFFFRNIEIRNAKNISFGNYNKINKRTLLDGRGGKIVIGNNVDIAQDVNIWTLQHDPADDYYTCKGGDVTIEDYAWIASRATILPNVTIGKGAVVATGALVTKDVEPMTIVGGVPAKVVGTRKSKLKYQLGKHRPWFE